jgi:hypothetical protein
VPWAQDEADGVIGLGLRQVQTALNRKADDLQREFVQISERLEDIGRKLLEDRGEARQELRAEQAELREQQQVLAGEINIWRERGRHVLMQAGQNALRKLLEELLAMQDPVLTPAVQHALYLLDAPDEELARLAESPERDIAETPALRLIKRARSEIDLRGTDPTARRRAAVEFANRPGISQDDRALSDIETARQDPDPQVREIADLTAIQILRFRAMRVADLEIAHAAVKQLATFENRAVLPVLIEVLEKPRTGFAQGEHGAEEQENAKTRLVALLRLVEWHTPDAQLALQARRFDRDEHIVKAALRALELFPGEWTGPLKPPDASAGASKGG